MQPLCELCLRHLFFLPQICDHIGMKEISDVQLLFCLKNKKTENLDFQDFPASVTGDERIELPLRVLETPVMPFDQSPMALRYSYFITHFPGNVNDIFEIIQKNEINFYNFQLCRAFSSLCRASSRVLRWQAYTRCSIQILTDSAAHPSAYGHR